jgi:hypothetical protein
MSDDLILWRRVDRPGHEAARVGRFAEGWLLAGTALFADEARPCRLDYRIVCDAAWRTASATIEGWVGPRAIDIALEVGVGQRWVANGVEAPAVAGCIDLDLNFSPSTNLLPIRRLQLEVGQEATVQAAWLRFPSFELEPLEQRYRRLDETTYRYESAGGRFVTVLQVSAAGFVTRYPNFFETA